jgi:hypothetical protein
MHLCNYKLQGMRIWHAIQTWITVFKYRLICCGERTDWQKYGENFHSTFGCHLANCGRKQVIRKYKIIHRAVQEFSKNLWATRYLTLGPRTVTRSKFYTGNPQISGTTVRSLVPRAIWRPGFVHRSIMWHISTKQKHCDNIAKFLSAVQLNIQVLWHVRPCRLANNYRRFRGE